MATLDTADLLHAARNGNNWARQEVIKMFGASGLTMIARSRDTVDVADISEYEEQA